MVGLLVTLVFATVVAMASQAWLIRFRDDLDPAERLGIGGIFGLGAIGTAMLVVLYLPSGVLIATGLAVLLPVASLAWALKTRALDGLRFGLPQGVTLLGPVVLAILAIFPLIAVLAPSDSTDWDSLAYHLAVPKLWIAQGQASYVPAIHHSNFPFAVDNLYILGLQWGGQSGAKAFSLAFLVFGMIGLFGLARRWYGSPTAWWAPVGLAAAPVVLWEAGTAYIDVAHGLFAGLGLLYAGDVLKRTIADGNAKPYLLLTVVALSLGAGSKYTGLQIVVVTALALFLLMAGAKRTRQGLTTAIFVGLVAVGLAAPWYIKNAVVVGNPVYPFFSGVHGGRDWGEWHAAVYKDEQQSFGVGRTETGRDPLQFGHAVLGLAYQPGRFVNPQQQIGLGFPTGAIGFVGLLAMGLWGASGRAGRREQTVLLACLLMFGLWFFLSQQSRYLTSVVVPGAVLAAGAVRRLKIGPVLSVGIAGQAAYTAWMLHGTQTVDQLSVVTGRVSTEEYQTARIGFYPASQAINQNGDVEQVVLFDEVFGYLLDVPYMWGNPGHSTVIPYSDFSTGREFAAGLKKLGFSHVYMNLQFMDRASQERWLAAAGLSADEPYTDDERETMFQDPNFKWRWLLADALRSGHLRLTLPFSRSFLLEVTEEP